MSWYYFWMHNIIDRKVGTNSAWYYWKTALPIHRKTFIPTLWKPLTQILYFGSEIIQQSNTVDRVTIRTLLQASLTLMLCYMEKAIFVPCPIIPKKIKSIAFLPKNSWHHLVGQERVTKPKDRLRGRQRPERRFQYNPCLRLRAASHFFLPRYCTRNPSTRAAKPRVANPYCNIMLRFAIALVRYTAVFSVVTRDDTKTAV